MVRLLAELIAFLWLMAAIPTYFKWIAGMKRLWPDFVHNNLVLSRVLLVMVILSACPLMLLFSFMLPKRIA